MNDPCCNITLQWDGACCLPRDIEYDSVAQDVLNVTLIEENCNVDSLECVESFFQDLADTLTGINDPVSGCSSLVEQVFG